MEQLVGGTAFKSVRKKLLQLLAGDNVVLVGHSIEHDLAV